MSLVRGLLPAALLAGAAGAANAGVYWFHGVRDNTVTVCFVGDAVTSRPDRVSQVLGYLREFEYSVNVRFDYLGRCPASVMTPNGRRFLRRRHSGGAAACQRDPGADLDRTGGHRPGAGQGLHGVPEGRWQVLRQQL